MEHIARWASRQLAEALSDTPVVVVNGARQVGKSTLVASLPYPGSMQLVSLDDAAVREAAREDPRAFVERAVDTLVIDEVQLEPTLFRAVPLDTSLVGHVMTRSRPRAVQCPTVNGRRQL